MRIHIERLLKKRMKTSLAMKLKSAIETRQKLVFNNSAMICAVYLDPRYRAEITQYQSIASENEAKMKLIELWNRLNMIEQSNSMNNISTSGNLSTSSIFNSSDSFDSTRDMNEYLRRGGNVSSSSDITGTETNDINTAIEAFNPEFMPMEHSIIQYWENRKDENPLLYKLAMAIYAIPPTEVQIERDFSALDKILTKYRTKLSPAILEGILLIHLNKDLFYEIRNEKLNKK